MLPCLKLTYVINPKIMVLTKKYKIVKLTAPSKLKRGFKSTMPKPRLKGNRVEAISNVVKNNVKAKIKLLIFIMFKSYDVLRCQQPRWHTQKNLKAMFPLEQYITETSCSSFGSMLSSMACVGFSSWLLTYPAIHDVST